MGGSLVNHQSICRQIMAGLLLLYINSAAHALDGFLGMGGEAEETPSLTLTPAEITLHAPTPVQANALALLLAQADGGNSLSERKEKAEQKFAAYLNQVLEAGLQEYFADEEVPLVPQEGALRLHNYLDVSVGKQMTDLKSYDDYELERGILKVAGSFHYRLEDSSGKPLREQRINIADLKVQGKYRLKTSHINTESEDTTDAGIERALSEMVGRLLHRIEDDLEADELRKMAAL